MKVTANEIQKELLNFVKGGYDVVLPNFYFGYHECDVFRINQSDFVIEYEIKVSRSDFFNDFKKDSADGDKHRNLLTGVGVYCPNRFFFVVPEGLISLDEVPKYAGLIYYKGRRHFEFQKTGKLIHKQKFTNYRSICHTLAGRDEGHRKRIKEIRNTDYDKEMAAMKREVEGYRKSNREISNDLFLLKAKSGNIFTTERRH